MGKKRDMLAVLKQIADECGGKVHTYSGRFMYGRQCLSIYCDHAGSCLEAAGAHRVRGASTDSMGLGAVVYWQHIPADLAKGRLCRDCGSIDEIPEGSDNGLCAACERERESPDEE